MKTMEQLLSTQIQQRWRTVTPKDWVQLPPTAYDNAPLQAVCRALLLETDIEASQEYQSNIEVLQHTKTGIALSRLRPPQSIRENYVLRVCISQLTGRFFDVAHPIFCDYVERWLFHSMAGGIQTLSMALLDVVGVDLSKIEAERERREPWASYYSDNRKLSARVELRQATKALGWKAREDEALLKTASGWVRFQHVFNGSMKDFIEFDGLEKPDVSDERNWRRKFKEINDILGYRPKAGRPRLYPHI